MKTTFILLLVWLIISPIPIYYLSWLAVDYSNPTPRAHSIGTQMGNGILELLKLLLSLPLALAVFLAQGLAMIPLLVRYSESDAPKETQVENSDPASTPIKFNKKVE